ncbi:cardiolipin synthase (CMP-forming) [Lepisosteus oculatus]|uniref:Cardiolipin synthase (CMP-forming) n=1 Tax=Lepisosteus oculatus TaxID=7918 RepID=W5NI55_LEPOC|nr:PREDICTED: cardiolipin synthase (CMP-forming) [Lepisosteus oculatus]
MLSAYCKSNLITCAKGHVLSPLVDRYSAVALSCGLWSTTNVMKASPATSEQKTFIKHTKTERKCFQRLKAPLSSRGQSLNFEECFTDGLLVLRSTFNTGRCVVRKDSSASALPIAVHPTQQNSFSFQTQGNTAIDGRLKGCWEHSMKYSRLTFLSTKLEPVFRTNATLGGSGVPQCGRGYSSTTSGKPPGDGNHSLSKEKRSGNESSPNAEEKTLSRPEGLSNFKELYENPWTIPNFLCMARIGLSPVLGYLIVEKDFNLSLCLFVLAGVTDLLDGYIARNWASQKSALGSALDPLADKILISVLYISLTYAHLIPAPLTAMVISRDIALIAAVFYVRYKTVPPPRTISKYFNPCYATAQLKPTFISKVNTAVQLALVAASLAAPVFHYVDSIFLQALWYITGLTTTASAYSYYHYGKKTVQVLNNTK